MPIHTGRLLLCTQDPYLLPEQTRLTMALTAAGFLGTPLAYQADAYVVGERFLQLITFAGCSVRIELSPDGDGPFSHLRFVGPFDQPWFLVGRNTRPPRCRSCRSPLQGWREDLTRWHRNGAMDIPCPACGEPRPPWAYDWREKAGFGRFFIQVEEVFPGEAAPTPELTKLLEHTTVSQWSHFYIQDA